MNPVEQPLEFALSKEARHRELLDMYDNEDWEGLLGAAELLNEALVVQQTMNRWLAKEAADNLAAAVKAQYASDTHPGDGDGPPC